MSYERCLYQVKFSKPSPKNFLVFKDIPLICYIKTVVYLNLMSPVDADIPSVKDSPAHYADGFHVMFDHHCKVMQCRSYIWSEYERDVIFFHRFHEPFSLGLLTAVMQDSRFNSLANCRVS